MSLLSRNRSTDDLPELDAGAVAELDALDAAIAGDEITDDALAALVRDVRAAAPEMRPEATQHLNERVAARFDHPGAAGKSRGAGRRLSAPVLAAASIVLVGVVVSVGILASPDRGSDAVVMSDMANGFDAGGGKSSSAAPATGDQTSPDADAGANLLRGGEVAEAPDVEDFARPAGGASASGSGVTEQANEYRTDAGGATLTASGAAGSSATAPSARAESPAVERLSPDALKSGAAASAPDARSKDRAVERSVDLQVRVKNGGLPEAAGKVSQITRDANGYVANSDLSLGGKGTGSATFTLRVDSTKLARAIDRLSGLGTVTAQNESSRDITSAVDSAQGRLDDANRVRKALLRALSKADSDGEIASLRLRIAENRRLRASLDAQLQQVQRRADLTTVAFTLTAPSKGDPAADDGSWTLGDAASDAWNVLRTVLGGLLVGAAFAAPFALLAVLGWVAFKARRRRARERALDA